MLILLFLAVSILSNSLAVDTQHQRTFVKPLELFQRVLQDYQSKTICEARSLRQIEHVKEFLEKSLNKQLSKYILKPLTKPGDNYNFLVQALEVESIKDESEVETLQLICKTPARFVTPSHSKQFLNEVHFYSDIIPAIEQFEQKAKVPQSERFDAFVRYFGSRVSLDPNATHVDGGAAILLENVKPLDFVVLDRRGKFEREEILAILKRLAKLHALIIAMRRLERNLFYTKVDPYLHTRYNDSFLETLINMTDKFANNLPIAFPNMTTEVLRTIRHQLNNSKEYLRMSSIHSASDTPYTTIYHRDLWAKNILIKNSDGNDGISYIRTKTAVNNRSIHLREFGNVQTKRAVFECNGTIAFVSERKDGAAANSIQVKILDFQAYYYESFAFDLTFFLLYNAQIGDLNTHFKSFIEYYHSEFVKTMRLVNCPLDDYTYDKMWDEIKRKAKLNLLKLYLYLAFDQIEILQANDGTASDVDRFLEQLPPELILNRWKCINDLYIEHDLFGNDFNLFVKQNDNKMFK